MKIELKIITNLFHFNVDPCQIDQNNIFNLAFDRYEMIGDAKKRPCVEARGNDDRL